MIDWNKYIGAYLKLGFDTSSGAIYRSRLIPEYIKLIDIFRYNSYITKEPRITLICENDGIETRLFDDEVIEIIEVIEISETEYKLSQIK
jgi:hypothetical protein